MFSICFFKDFFFHFIHRGRVFLFQASSFHNVFLPERDFRDSISEKANLTGDQSADQSLFTQWMYWECFQRKRMAAGQPSRDTMNPHDTIRKQNKLHVFLKAKWEKNDTKDNCRCVKKVSSKSAIVCNNDFLKRIYEDLFFILHKSPISSVSFLVSLLDGTTITINQFQNILIPSRRSLMTIYS